MATKKTPKKVTKIDMGIYPVSIYVGNDLGLIGNYVKKDLESPKLKLNLSGLDSFESDNAVDGYVTNLLLDDEDFGVIIARFKGKPAPSVIAHECVHIKNMIYKYVRMDISSSMVCDENEAYIVEHLVKHIYELFYGKE